MSQLDGASLDAQSPEQQYEVLESIERDDRITVGLDEGDSASGSVTNVTGADSSGTVEEVHVQFLDPESGFRDDDQAHYTVSVKRGETGEWTTAELSYSVSDMGRVRVNTVGTVSWIWPGLSELRRTTVLARPEPKLLLMKEMGMSEEEMAEKWNCNPTAIRSAFATIQVKHWRAEQTVNKLSSIGIEQSQSMYEAMDMSNR